LKEFVSKIKDLKDSINIDIKGDVADIIKDPRVWAESVADAMIAQNADRLIKARKLGEEFGKRINRNKEEL
tara:strand:- start:2340 stop:2552 length:213 start_codon:yes stop_codon:yes gene_type:complete